MSTPFADFSFHAKSAVGNDISHNFDVQNSPLSLFISHKVDAYVRERTLPLYLPLGGLAIADKLIFTSLKSGGINIHGI